MTRRLLTDDQIKIAKELRKQGYTKRMLAVHFGVGKTTIWEHVYRKKINQEKDKLKSLIRNIRRTCIPCSKCEICLTKIAINEHTIPLNYQVGDKCIVCYLRERGLTFMDLYDRE